MSSARWLLVVCLGGTLPLPGPAMGLPARVGLAWQSREASAPPRPPRPAHATPTGPEADSQAELKGLASWPSRRARDVVESWVAAGTSRLVPARDLLRREEPGVRAAACEILSRIGTWRESESIRRQILDPTMKPFIGDLLEAYHRLDATSARHLAIMLLASVRGATSRLVVRFLERRFDPSVLVRLRPLLDHPRSRVRRLAFGLLRSLEDPELPSRALDLLDSHDARLVRDAAAYLGERAPTELVARIQKLARGPIDPLYCHGVLLLCRFEQRGMRGVLPDDQAARMMPLIRSSDPFLRAASCVGLLTLGFREASGVTRAQLAGQVIPSLIDLFTSGRLFEGFWTALPVAARSLEKVTRWSVGTDLMAWRRAWEARPDPIRIWTELARIDPAVAADARIEWRRSDEATPWPGRGVRFFAGKAETAPVERGVIRVILSREAMTQLVGALIEAGLFTGDSRQPTLGSRTPVPAGWSVRVESGDGYRDIPFAPSEAQDLEVILQRSLVANQWQLYPPPDDPYPVFWEREAAWWSAPRSDEERANRLIRLVTQSLAGLDAEMVPGALDQLEVSLDEGGKLEPLRVTELIQFALAAPRLDEPVRHAIRLATRVGDPLLFRPLAFALLKSYGRSAEPLITDVMVALEQVATSLTDADPRLRRLAVAAAATLGSAAIPLLAERLDDPVSQVRERAITTLGEVGGTEAVEMLIGQVHAAGGTLQRAAIRALGQIGDARALATLVEATQASRLDVALEATEALSWIGGERAVGVLVSRFVSAGPGSLLGARAAEGLRRVGGETVRRRLEALIDSPRDEVRREAICLLGEMGIDRVASRLVAMLDEEAAALRARGALTVLTQQDERAEPWKFRALIDSGVTFVDAFLLARRSPAGIVATDLRGPSRSVERAGPVLLDSIGDDRWWVRDAACVLLREMAGRPGPSPAKSADATERRQIRATWESILAAAVEPAAGVPR